MSKYKTKAAAIGVDIGGTSVKLGLVTPLGRVVLRESFLTSAVRGRSKMLDVLSGHILDLVRQARRAGFRVAGVGVGAPGPVDVERGFVYFFPNIPGFKDTPLAGFLSRRTKLKVRVDNDANVMALAEFRFGAGRPATRTRQVVRSMIALTLGTGVGGGIILDGKLFHGARFSAAEIGHMTLNEDGPRCSCGSRGCLETYVGSGYFTKALKARTGRTLTPRLAASAARRGDRACLRQWRQAGTHLGRALAGLANLLNPERIVIGGGLALSGDLLFKPLKRAFSDNAFPIAAESAKVVPAKLGTEAGLVGAAALVLNA